MERGKAKVIGGDPKGATFTYTNGNTVIVRDIAVRFLFHLLSPIDIGSRCGCCWAWEMLIRSVYVQNPAIAYTYNEHPSQATVAKYAPSGFYIASAGQSCP
jgi:hypothetical protein